MNKILPLPKAVWLVATLLFSLASYSQLPAFTLNLGSTPETCGGNGSITITVAGTAPGAIMLYDVFLLPNETTPVTSVNAGPVLNRPAGNYKVVATQTLGALHNEQTAFVTIANNTIPVLFNITHTNARCGNDGTLTVNVTSGSVATYQITSPITTPPQASNVFTGLGAGTYTVRINGTCGEIFNPQQIIGQATGFIAIDGATFEDNPLVSCNQISLSHFYGTITNNTIFYPLVFTFTVFPPGGGAPIIVTQNVAGGSAAGGDVFATLPFYHDQQYSYNVTVTDACGTTFQRLNNTINRKFDVSASPSEVGCSDNKLTITPKDFIAPYTVSFTQTPVPTFNPTAFNPQHPSFSDDAEYGAAGNSIPEGDYTIVVTDACGRSVTKSFTVEDSDKEASAEGEVEGCSPTGTLTAAVSNRDIATVIISQGPVGYPTPHDVSVSVKPDGSFERANMPVGHYILQITDTCGDTYTAEADMQPVAANPTLGVLNRPGCAPGMGSIRLALPESDNTFASVIITSAPAGFSQPLPYTATALAVGQYFYMGAMPQGVYNFTTVDNCGVTRTQSVTVQGYAVQSNNITITPYCGAFSINVQHVSNGTTSASYWLQRYNPGTNTWGHPASNIAYPANTLPTGTNSVFLQNNQTLNNQQYFGEFRVLKVFYTFNNGTATNQMCHEVIDTFTFDGYPEIIAAHPFPCAGGLTEVAIEAIGVAPLQYRITEKNSQPFLVNNGTSNLFSGLEPASYKVIVRDNCGNEEPYVFTINNLAPPTITPTGFCEGENSSLAVQQFTFLNYEWFETSNPTVVLSTTNVLNFPAFNSLTDTGTYAVRLISTTGNTCMNQTLAPFTIMANDLPNAGADNLNIAMCAESGNVNLNSYLSAGHDTGGSWEDTNSSGQLTGSILDTDGLAAGTYSFKYTVSGDCSLTDDAIVSFDIKQKPLAPVPAAIGQVCEGDDVQLSVNAVAGATYSWTGPNGYTSSAQNPFISNAVLQNAGNYNVTVTVNGCTSDPAQVAVAVGRRPVITISGNSTLCAGQTSVLTATVNNMNQTNIVLGWYLDDVQIPGEYGLSLNIDEIGDYKLVMSALGCEGEAVFAVSAGSVDGDIVLDKGCNTNAEYIVAVVNTADFAGATYTWDGPGGYQSTGAEAVITRLSPGDYTVTVDIGGCEKSETINVPNTFCMIPKGISPNDDEYNNSFDLSNFDVRNLKIFNRYGMRVYEQDNYTDQWHGQSFAGELPTGTYYYVIEFDAGNHVTGWVYLMREI